MSEFMDFLKENLDGKSFDILCGKFGGTKVYISQNLSKTPAEIMKYHELTRGSPKERANKTKELMQKNGFFVSLKKIRWTIKNGKKRALRNYK